jgi:hypothetical protein
MRPVPEPSPLRLQLAPLTPEPQYLRGEEDCEQTWNLRVWRSGRPRRS